MEPQSCLTDPTVPVVADASVLINLNATKRAKPILEFLPNPFLVVSQVILELRSGIHVGRNDAGAVDELRSSGQVHFAQLGKTGKRYFSDLVFGFAFQTLDDGEAATIAHALELSPSAIPLIDERKATRICAERFPGLDVGSTVDVLAQDDVWTGLGRAEVTEAVFEALYTGRMRVLPHQLNWVLHLIGPERAEHCRSLPRNVRY